MGACYLCRYPTRLRASPTAISASMASRSANWSLSSPAIRSIQAIRHTLIRTCARTPSPASQAGVHCWGKAAAPRGTYATSWSALGTCSCSSVCSGRWKTPRMAGASRPPQHHARSSGAGCRSARSTRWMSLALPSCPGRATTRTSPMERTRPTPCTWPASAWCWADGRAKFPARAYSAISARICY
ncbi:hypothetical protein D3C78_1105300 [compost metagenome]